MISGTISDELYSTITWNGEEGNSCAYSFFISRCCKFISNFTAVWNIDNSVDNFEHVTVGWENLFGKDTIIMECKKFKPFWKLPADAPSLDIAL